MAFIAICYMNINMFALQHIADRPGEYRTYVQYSNHGDLFAIQMPSIMAYWYLVNEPVFRPPFESRFAIQMPMVTNN